jgi:hypothetical protein
MLTPDAAAWARSEVEPMRFLNPKTDFAFKKIKERRYRHVPTSVAWLGHF